MARTRHGSLIEWNAGKSLLKNKAEHIRTHTNLKGKKGEGEEMGENARQLMNIVICCYPPAGRPYTRSSKVRDSLLVPTRVIESSPPTQSSD